MSRVQLALNVDDLDEAIAFYSKLFNTQPAKVKEGYANRAARSTTSESRWNPVTPCMPKSPDSPVRGCSPRKR